MAAGGLLSVPNRGHVAEFTAGGALQQAIARPGGASARAHLPGIVTAPQFGQIKCALRTGRILLYKTMKSAAAIVKSKESEKHGVRSAWNPLLITRDGGS